MSVFEYFVRLDYLEYQESFVVPKIGFRGWTVVPDLSYLEKIQITPLVFDLSEERASFHKGTVASNLLPFSKPHKIKFRPTNRNVSAYDSKLSGIQVIFEGEFEVDVTAGKFGVILDALLEKSRALSNQWEFVVSPEAMRYQARGGFFSPRISWIQSSFFIFSGWAYREGDEISNVDLNINGMKIQDVVIGLNSKSLRESLLNVKGSDRSVFAKIISVEELGLKNISKWLDLKAEVTFKSGEKFKLAFPAFRLEQKSEDNNYIESASVGLDGVARISGFSMFGRVGAKTRTGFVEFARSKGKRNEHFPESVTSRSFETGGSLGKLPGFAKIYLKTSKGWVGAEPAFLQRHFRKTLSRFLFRFSITKGMLNQLLSIFTQFGTVPIDTAPKVENQKKNSKRLFIASHNLSAVEGAPKVLLDVISSLNLGFEEILLISPEDGALAEQWRKLGAVVEIVADLDRAQELAYEFSPGLVFANTISSYWAVALANELAVPSIWSIHESVSPYQSMVNLPYEFWMTFAQALKFATKICFVSEITEKLYLSQSRSISSKVIANAVESFTGVKDRVGARSSLGLKDSDYMLLCVGTTAYRKGQDIILKEARAIKEKIDKSLVCYFVGARESDFLDLLRIMAAEIDLKVNFIPETSDIENYYLAADVKVIASREESAPLVSLEAMKYGVPIVSTNVFGLAEQLEDRKTCLFFDPSKKGEMTEKVLEISTDSVLRESLIENGIRTVNQRFSKTSQMENYRNVVLEVLKTV